MTTTAAAPPLVRVTRGNPTPEELAAPVAVLLARTGPQAPAAPDRRHRAPNWNRLERTLSHRGPRSWRGERRPGVPQAA